MQICTLEDDKIRAWKEEPDEIRAWKEEPDIIDQPFI